MMTLFDLEKKQKAKVLGINSTKELKNRLSSFGILKGSIITMDKFSATKSTIKISTDFNMIALRASEAKAIEVSLL